MNSKYLKDVTTLKLEESRCIGCGRCLDVCPHNVFALNDGKAVIINRDSCMECSACVKNCPSSAVEVKQGVGCAFAIIKGWLTGSEPSCDCSGGNTSSDGGSSGCC